MDEFTAESFALALKHAAEQARTTYRAIYDHSEALLALQDRAWRHDVPLDLRDALDIIHDAEAGYARALEELAVRWLRFDMECAQAGEEDLVHG